MTKMPVSPKAAVKDVQDVSSLAAKAFASMFRRPFYVRDILTQMDIVGVGSLTVVMLTGFFTGAVLTLQSSKTLTTFGAVAFTGQLVAVSLVRELGPGADFIDDRRPRGVRHRIGVGIAALDGANQGDARLRNE